MWLLSSVIVNCQRQHLKGAPDRGHVFKQRPDHLLSEHKSRGMNIPHCLYFLMYSLNLCSSLVLLPYRVVLVICISAGCIPGVSVGST